MENKKNPIIEILTNSVLTKNNEVAKAILDNNNVPMPEASDINNLNSNIQAITREEGESQKSPIILNKIDESSKKKALEKSKHFFETNTLLNFAEYKQYIEALLEYYFLEEKEAFNMVSDESWKGRKNAFIYRNRNQIVQEAIENIIVARCIIEKIENNIQKIDKFFYFSDKTSTSTSVVNYTPYSHIQTRVDVYFDSLESIGMAAEKKKFTAYAVSAKVVEDNADDLQRANFSLKILDTERMNQIGSNYHFLSATFARVIIFFLTMAISVGEKVKFATGTTGDRMLLNFRKLRLIFKHYYTKKTKGRCLRISSLLKGTAKNFFRKGFKDIYKSDAYLAYLETDEMYISDIVYDKMTRECKNKKGFLTRRRCHRLIKAIKNFDEYVDTRTCLPKRGTRSIGGKKNKSKNKSKKRGGEEPGGAIGVSVGLLFWSGVVLMAVGYLKVQASDPPLGLLLVRIGASFVVFSVLVIGVGYATINESPRPMRNRVVVSRIVDKDKNVNNDTDASADDEANDKNQKHQDATGEGYQKNP